MDDDIPEVDLLVLANFSLNNPEISLSATNEGIVIDNPWDDPTLQLQVPSANDTLITALNFIRLPPSLTAIYHLDTQDLEIIYTALPVDPEIRQRKFQFQYRESTYECSFDDASERLLLIAEAAEFVKSSSGTNHRNLTSFKLLSRFRRFSKEDAPHTATSFWIRSFPWDENQVLDLVRHLNFFMTYFDVSTPTILVHEEVGGHTIADPPVRYPFKEFPTIIAGRQINSYLLGLWESATKSPDPFRRFLYNYQILEYVSFYYLKEGVFQRLLQVVRSPEVLARPSEAVHQIQDILVDEKITDEQKIDNLAKSIVDPAKLWCAIEPNLAHFCEDVTFDGGFTLNALVMANCTSQDFVTSGVVSFSQSIRKIRNALVHARELRQSASIAPTRANYERLKPWIPPLATLAAEALLSWD